MSLLKRTKRSFALNAQDHDSHVFAHVDASNDSDSHVSLHIYDNKQAVSINTKAWYSVINDFFISKFNFHDTGDLRTVIESLSLLISIIPNFNFSQHSGYIAMVVSMFIISMLTLTIKLCHRHNLLMSITKVYVLKISYILLQTLLFTFSMMGIHIGVNPEDSWLNVTFTQIQDLVIPSLPLGSDRVMVF